VRRISARPAQEHGERQPCRCAGFRNTEIWYSFLNLGFNVLPVAGADWPHFGPALPGVERTSWTSDDCGC